MTLFAPRKLSRAVGESPMVKEAQAAGLALAQIKEWDEVCRSGEPVTKIAISVPAGSSREAVYKCVCILVIRNLPCHTV